MQQQPQLACGVLQLVPIACGGFVLWVPEHRDGGELGHDFLEQLQPFSAQLRGDLVQARDVAAGPREALREAGFDKSLADSTTMGMVCVAFLTAYAGDV